MLPAQDLGIFFADFGLPCSAGGVSFCGLLDQPDEPISMAGVSVMSTMYQLTLRSSDAHAAALTTGHALTVAGLPYVVRELRQIDDGALTLATLSK